MFKKKISETKAIKIFRKHGVTILPGELKIFEKSLLEVETDYPSYNKRVHTKKKRLQICKYEEVVDTSGRQIPFMTILEYNCKCFIYESRRCALAMATS